MSWLLANWSVTRMVLVPWRPARQIALQALSVLLLATASMPAVAQSPTAEQIEAFKSLPPEQQKALIKQYQSDGLRNGVVADKPLSMPTTVLPAAAAPEDQITVAPGTQVIDEITRLPRFGYDLFAGVPTTFAPATDIPVPANYVIGPGDMLSVQLFGSRTGSYELVVNRDGRVNFPEIGPVHLAGLLFDDARAAIEKRVTEELIGVRVGVTMGDLRSIRIFVLGDVERPGSYTVSGLSTITNALFASGGVKPIGSLRNVQLKRGGQVVGQIDLYDLLLHGDTSDDVRLLPGDVIFVPPVGMTVGIAGEVKRPAIYEIKGKATVGDLIMLAGGLEPTADPRLAKLERINEKRQRVVIDLDATGGAGRAARLQAGDVLRIQRVLQRYEQSITLAGHVYRPGRFEWRPGIRLSDILQSPDELQPKADTHYVLIRREQQPPERKILALSVDLEVAWRDPTSSQNIELWPRDQITVFDREATRSAVVDPLVLELRRQATPEEPANVVSIGGSVKAPGTYPLETDMRVTDLVRAGGMLDQAAYGGKAEVTRYVVVGGERRVTEVVEVDLADARRGEPTANIALRPFDHVVIREVADWREQEFVVLAGEVKFPGTYPIRRGESLLAVLERAGGLTDLAFAEGAIFARRELREREENEIRRLSRRLEADLASLALAQAQETEKPSEALVVGQDMLEKLNAVQATGRMAMDLPAVIRSGKGSPGDILLVDGDRLLIPRASQAVTVLGEVHSATSHLYESGLSIDDYLRMSGGTTRRADSSSIYVIHANGMVSSSGRNGWFGRGSQAVRPGDTIVVPIDAERMRPLSLWTAVSTVIFNLAVAVAAVGSI